MKHRTALLLMLAIILGSCSGTSDETYLVVLSVDGFRWDYPDKTNTPALDSIARVGTKAQGMIPVFPSKTFPNHYTMATGLYPDHHGLVNNTFLDPETGAIYRISDSSTRNNPYFYGGEPIWLTASKAGMKTASFFWVGSEVPIKGVQPDYWKPYDQDIPFADRIDTVIYWLSMPVNKRPRLVMWYIHEPDAIGHKYGPDHPETHRMITHLDSLIGVFCKKINELPYADRINIIVTSDHGMANIAEEKSIELTDFIPETWVKEVIGGNPNYNILAAEGYLDSIYQRLSTVEHMKVWKNPDLPESFHYGNNPRTLDLTVAADLEWSIFWHRNPRYVVSGGTHGYDPANREMHAIFYASGPSFKTDYIHPAFENVNLYALMSELLGITPAPNDGNLDVVKDMLNDQPLPKE